MEIERFGGSFLGVKGFSGVFFEGSQEVSAKGGEHRMAKGREERVPERNLGLKSVDYSIISAAS